MSIGRISLLGQPEASFEGRPVRFGLKKALALLCYLATEGGRHPRGELAELLWPRSDGRRARTDLRSALAKLRKTPDLGFYRGEFVEGFSVEDAPEFELWLETERTRWRALFGELCERVSRLEGEKGL